MGSRWGEEGEPGRAIARHRYTGEFVVVERCEYGEVAGAYRALSLIDAARALVEGDRWDAEDAERLRGDETLYDELPEDRYGGALDCAAAERDCRD